MTGRPKTELAADLEQILARTEKVWDALRGARLLVTGGTGFIGCWFLESLRHANTQLELGIHATVLTRSPAAFDAKHPALASYPGFHFVAGDVRALPGLDGKRFSHVIHAATDASADLNDHDPLRMFDTIVTGTRNVLQFAQQAGATRVLFLSSGAVYGRQPWEVERIAESWNGAPDQLDARNTYAEAKRAAELLCSIHGAGGLNVSIARIFAALGPYLPLDAHFAAGNFIRDAIAGRTIAVNGNGRPVRSYAYAADLTVWLWHILVRGEAGVAYNVGSEEAVTIAELASRVARVLGTDFKILGASDGGWNPGRYVPDTSLATRQLGLSNLVPLDDAILRTATWNGWTKSPK